MTLCFIAPLRSAEAALHFPAERELAYAVLDASGAVAETGLANLARLVTLGRQATKLLMLLPATDARTFRLPVPPMPAARLQAALPSLVEEHIIGEPEHCVIVAGNDVGGQRELALIDRRWLQALLLPFTGAGIVDLAAVPLQCASHLNWAIDADDVAARLFLHGDEAELVLRLADSEIIGLRLDAVDPQLLAAAVAQAIDTLAPGQRVTLRVDPDSAPASLPPVTETGARLDLQQQATDWAALYTAARKQSLDLARLHRNTGPATAGNRHWRKVALLALALASLNLGALGWDTWRLKRESDRMRSAMVDRYRALFPNDTVVLDPLAQLRRHASTGPTDDVGRLLADLDASLQAAAPGSTVKAIRYDDGKLAVEWPSADERPPLQRLQQALAAHALAMDAPVDAQRLSIGRQR